MPVLKTLAVALTTIFLLAMPVMAQEAAPAPENPVADPVPACPFAAEGIDPYGTDTTGQGANSIQQGAGECTPLQRAEEVPGLLESVDGIAGLAGALGGQTP
ncbi:MAG: hypothetical protein ACRD0K_11195 [Egibacteraceae bacterium]